MAVSSNTVLVQVEETQTQQQGTLILRYCCNCILVLLSVVEVIISEKPKIPSRTAAEVVELGKELAAWLVLKFFNFFSSTTCKVHPFDFYCSAARSARAGSDMIKLPSSTVLTKVHHRVTSLLGCD